MERQRPNIIKRVVVGGVRLGMAVDIAFSGGAVFNPNGVIDNSSRSNDPSPPRILSLNNPLPPLGTHFAQIPDPTPTLIPTPQPTEVVPTPTPEPTVNYQEVENVVSKMEARQDIFSKQDVADVRLYYPIYKAISDKYQIDWELEWITHKIESKTSRDSRYRNGSTYPYVGPTQIDILYYSQDFIKHSADGLEYLADYQQRFPDDYIYLAATGKILHDHIARYLGRGRDQQTAILLALENYAGTGPGIDRYYFYKYLLDKVFK